MYHINRENAKQLSEKGNKIRWSLEYRNRAKQPPPATSEPAPKESPKTLSEFESKTLMRVRIQLDKIFDQFMKERDPAKLDRLAAAQARLSEQERILAGRPMPGSLKPTADKPRRTNHDFTPQPVVSSVPQSEPNTPTSTPPVQ